MTTTLKGSKLTAIRVDGERARRGDTVCAGAVRQGKGFANHGGGSSTASGSCRSRPTYSWAGAGPGGRDFYVRQLWDMKASVDTSALLAPGMPFHGGLCGWALASAHAGPREAVAISAYLGSSDTFDGAVADFAEAYAEQNEADYRAFLTANTAGRDVAEGG